MNEKRKITIGPGDTGLVEYTTDIRGEHSYIVELPDGTKRPRGRPHEWDWLSAYHHLVAKVGKEGLPQGRKSRCG